MEELVREIRQEFRIPPYYEDAAIERNIKEGEFRLSLILCGEKKREAGAIPALRTNTATTQGGNHESRVIPFSEKSTC